MKSILPSGGRSPAWLLYALFLPGALTAQQHSSQPTLKVLYTFKVQGGTPTAIVEVRPGLFLGVAATSPGLFSITSNGTYKYFYGFPPIQEGMTVIGLTPALNGQT